MKAYFLSKVSILTWVGGNKKIKGLYEPTRESIEGFVLSCLRSNIYKMFVLGGGGGRGRGSLQSVKGSCVLRRFKKKFHGSRTYR